jgi:hypothetical protein
LHPKGRVIINNKPENNTNKPVNIKQGKINKLNLPKKN